MKRCFCLLQVWNLVATFPKYLEQLWWLFFHNLGWISKSSLCPKLSAKWSFQGCPGFLLSSELHKTNFLKFTLWAHLFYSNFAAGTFTPLSQLFAFLPSFGHSCPLSFMPWAQLLWNSPLGWIS
jgi:hypothetical protein